MLQQFYKPNNYLFRFIERFYVHEQLYKPVPEMPLLLPGTGLELVFHLKQPYSIKNKQCAKSHIICTRESVRLQANHSVNFIAVRFRSGAFRHFSQYPFTELNNQFPTVEDIWG